MSYSLSLRFLYDIYTVFGTLVIEMLAELQFLVYSLFLLNLRGRGRDRGRAGAFKK